jgi:hypothetical protein
VYPPAGGNVEVLPGHHPGCKALLDHLAAPAPVDTIDVFGRRDSLLLVLDDKPGHPFIDDLGHRPVRVGDHGRATSHRFDHDQAERLGPVDRHQQRPRVADEIVLRLLADLADECHQRIVQQGFDHGLEIFAVDRSREEGRAAAWRS